MLPGTYKTPTFLGVVEICCHIFVKSDSPLGGLVGGQSKIAEK